MTTGNKLGRSSPGAVSITTSGLVPATCQAKVGDEVTWTNDDTDAHEVNFEPGAGTPPPNSGSIAAGATYSYTFIAPGGYEYHIDADKKIKGKVVVS